MRDYRLNDNLDFGKHRNRTLADVLLKEPGYFAWCLEKIDDFSMNGITLEILEEHLFSHLWDLHFMEVTYTMVGEVLQGIFWREINGSVPTNELVADFALIHGTSEKREVALVDERGDLKRFEQLARRKQDRTQRTNQRLASGSTLGEVRYATPLGDDGDGFVDDESSLDFLDAMSGGWFFGDN